MACGASSGNFGQQAVQLSSRFGPIKKDEYALRQLAALHAQDWQTQLKIMNADDGSLEMPAKEESSVSASLESSMSVSSSVSGSRYRPPVDLTPDSISFPQYDAKIDYR